MLPALELIAVLATASPGDDGLHRERLPPEQIDRHLRAARKAKALLILDVQPGRAGFLDEVAPAAAMAARAGRRARARPGVACRTAGDPRQGDRQDERAGDQRRLGLARRHRPRPPPAGEAAARPSVHGLDDPRQAGRRPRPGLAITYNVDGFGTQSVKVAKYEAFAGANRAGFHDGFKLFYEEDTDLMRPRQVLALRPPPDVIVYE